MNALQLTMRNQYAYNLLLKRDSQQLPLPLSMIAKFLRGKKTNKKIKSMNTQNSRMLICLGLPKPIAGIRKPVLSMISGLADIAIVRENVRKKL